MISTESDSHLDTRVDAMSDVELGRLYQWEKIKFSAHTT